MMTITTYAALAEFVTGFASGHLNMAILCSRGGLGKSSETQQSLHGHDIVEIPGHITPLGLYKQLYEGQNRKVVFDEVDGLLDDKKHVVLLKQLGETRTRKRISWMSSSKAALEIDGGVGFFYTTSPLLILCNSFTAFNANQAALVSRAVAMHFAPSTTQILQKIQTFASDSEILSFLEQYHDCLPAFDLRTYRKLDDLKRARLDWKMYGLQESTVPAKVIEIAELLTSYSSDVERLKHYSGCRRDFYTWKSEAASHLKRTRGAQVFQGS